MEKWEYLTTFIEANVKDKETRSFLQKRFPGRRKMPKFTPESMMPELDKLGEEGWELVHIEPVARVGGKGDILFAAGPRWTNRYFCVFKRLKQQPVAPAQPVQPVYQAAPTQTATPQPTNPDAALRQP